MGTYNIREIMAYLPHRYPFLLIDRVLDLEPGGYTVKLKGQESGTGIGLFEAYDANETPPASAGLFNVSTRGTIGSASAVSIAGFVVTGNQPRKVLVRGVGPTLWTFGVQGVMTSINRRSFGAKSHAAARRMSYTLG